MLAGITVARVRARIEPGVGEAKATGQIASTVHAKHALEQALRIATRWGHAFIETEHLLAGLLADPSSRAVRLLADAGSQPAGGTAEQLSDAVHRRRRRGVALCAGLARAGRMIDLHSHLLPGIDDGPQTIDGCLDILRAAHADGITRIAATPHVRHDHPTTPEQMETGIAQMREAATASGIEVERPPGGKLDLAHASSLDDDVLRRFGLGGNPGLLLLEFPYVGWPLGLSELVFGLRVRGFAAVLAHPERNADVQERPERLRELVEMVFQLTAASVDGRLGRRNAAARGSCSMQSSRI